MDNERHHATQLGRDDDDEASDSLSSLGGGLVVQGSAIKKPKSLSPRPRSGSPIIGLHEDALRLTRAENSQHRRFFSDYDDDLSPREIERRRNMSYMEKYVV